MAKNDKNVAKKPDDLELTDDAGEPLNSGIAPAESPLQLSPFEEFVTPDPASIALGKIQASAETFDEENIPVRHAVRQAESDSASPLRTQITNHLKGAEWVDHKLNNRQRWTFVAYNNPRMVLSVQVPKIIMDDKHPNHGQQQRDAFGDPMFRQEVIRFSAGIYLCTDRKIARQLLTHPNFGGRGEESHPYSDVTDPNFRVSDPVFWLDVQPQWRNKEIAKKLQFVSRTNPEFEDRIEERTPTEL